MLYKNPRGVSCEGCHGPKGEGQKMGRLIRGKKEINITAPDIKKTTIEQIRKSMNVKKSIMPSYFLTDSELDAIVFYIRKKNEVVVADINATK